MRLRKCLTACLTLPVLLLGVPGCKERERIQPILPPVADLKAVTVSKPLPPPEIVTSAHAAAEYDIAIETWGDGLRAAGLRLCRWAEAHGASIRCN